MPDDAKPCPFCGSEHLYAVRPFRDDWRVQCASCNAIGPFVAQNGEEWEAWNRRATDPGPRSS